MILPCPEVGFPEFWNVENRFIRSYHPRKESGLLLTLLLNPGNRDPEIGGFGFPLGIEGIVWIDTSEFKGPPKRAGFIAATVVVGKNLLIIDADPCFTYHFQSLDGIRGNFSGMLKMCDYTDFTTAEFMVSFQDGYEFRSNPERERNRDPRLMVDSFRRIFFR